VTEFHEAQLDKNGTPIGARGRVIYTEKMMSADRCAAITLRAAYKRQREVLMGPGALAVWLKALAPGFLDWLAVKVFLEPIIRRAKAAQAKVKKDATSV
jgi:short-subunit dehydrogenase